MSKQSTGGDGRGSVIVSKTEQNKPQSYLCGATELLNTFGKCPSYPLKLRIFALVDDTGMCHGHSFF